jgi:lipopolysaccharide/colanic/teichoic acid biosynthesis glycosyltransferase
MFLTAFVSSSLRAVGAEEMESEGSVVPPATFYGRVGKRWLDVALSLLALLLLSPLLAFLAFLIKLTSVGPALFRQKAQGRGGRSFDFYKFRTMYCTAGDEEHRRVIRHVLQSREPVGYDSKGRPVYKITDDPRVTPVGRILRKFSLDELPQFYNVLRGEMSVVGPRPSFTYEAELYNDHQRLRLTIRPGITGLAQVTVRHFACFEEVVRCDLDYIRRLSFSLDLAIILKTIPALCRGV